jgi:hypothetical protein
MAHREIGAGAAHTEAGEGSVPRAGAMVAGRIPTSAVGEVGRGQRLGQHGEVGHSIEAPRGGATH